MFFIILLYLRRDFFLLVVVNYSIGDIFIKNFENDTVIKTNDYCSFVKNSFLCVFFYFIFFFGYIES